MGARSNCLTCQAGVRGRYSKVWLSHLLISRETIGIKQTYKNLLSRRKSELWEKKLWPSVPHGDDHDHCQICWWQLRAIVKTEKLGSDILVVNITSFARNVLSSSFNHNLRSIDYLQYNLHITSELAPLLQALYL